MNASTYDPETPAGRRARLNNPWSEPPQPWTRGGPTPGSIQPGGLPRAFASDGLVRLVQHALDLRGLSPVPRPFHEAPASFDGILSAAFPIHNGRGFALGWRAAVGQPMHGLVRFGILVNADQSDRTIWPSPAHNHAFRAWHEALHVELHAGLDVRGEEDVSRAHVEEARAQADTFGLTDRDLAMLAAETIGQNRVLWARGAFPVAQAAFVGLCLAIGTDAAIEAWPEGA